MIKRIDLMLDKIDELAKMYNLTQKSNAFDDVKTFLKKYSESEYEQLADFVNEQIALVKKGKYPKYMQKDDYSQLEMLLNEMVNLKEHGMTVHPTGKSAAVRLLVPALDFSKPFDEQIEKVEECFKAIEKMSEMVKRLDSAKIRLFLENNKA